MIFEFFFVKGWLSNDDQLFENGFSETPTFHSNRKLGAHGTARKVRIKIRLDWRFLYAEKDAAHAQTQTQRRQEKKNWKRSSRKGQQFLWFPTEGEERADNCSIIVCYFFFFDSGLPVLWYLISTCLQVESTALWQLSDVSGLPVTSPLSSHHLNS